MAFTFNGPRISITRNLDSSGASILIDAMLKHYYSNQSTELLTLDLSKVCFVKPSGLVPLVTYLEANKGTTIIVCPDNTDCLTYLAASNFIQIASKYAHLENDKGLSSSPSGSAETILPLTQLINSEDAGNVRVNVASALNRIMTDGDGIWNNIRKAISSTIHEMTANVFDHAQAGCGWVTAQRYFNSFQGKHYVEFAIGDAGRGIRASLAENYQHLAKLTDAESMYQMVRDGLSRRGERGGTGYSLIQSITEQYDGSFRLRSGDGALHRQRNGQDLLKGEELAFWPGTQLVATVTCG